MEETDKTHEKTADKPWLWKKGVSANPKGRPKGVKSLKQFAREHLLDLPDDEKDAFLDALPKELIWQMAEGRPEQKTETKVQLNTSFTPEQLENAKQAIINGLNNGRPGDRPPEPSIGAPVDK